MSAKAQMTKMPVMAADLVDMRRARTSVTCLCRPTRITPVLERCCEWTGRAKDRARARTSWSAAFASAWDVLGPAPRAEPLHVLMLPDFDRADAVGSYWGTRTFAELLIDCEEDWTSRAVLVGMLREGWTLSQ
jgi:hypothetical protein